MRDHATATAALIAYDAELSLLLQPRPMPDLQTLFTYEVPVCAIMDARHPLAGSGPVRLRDCLQFPLAMPDRSLSVRHFLDAALLRSKTPAAIVIESSSIDFLRHYVRRERAISFQISIGIPAARAGLVVRELDRRYLATMRVEPSQLRGRTLSIAATEFVQHLLRGFEGRSRAAHQHRHA